MKKIFLLFTLTILITSFVFAGIPGTPGSPDSDITICVQTIVSTPEN